MKNKLDTALNVMLNTSPIKKSRMKKKNTEIKWAMISPDGEIDMDSVFYTKGLSYGVFRNKCDIFKIDYKKAIKAGFKCVKVQITYKAL